MIALYFTRVSPIKIIEQDLIVDLQSRLTPKTASFFHFLSDTISFFSLGVPILYILFALINIEKRKTIIASSLVILISLGFSGLIGATIKRVIKEPRPYSVDNRILKLGAGGSYSFPSGHSVEATVAVIGCSMLLFTSPLAITLAVLWGILVMFSRIILGVHSFTDVLGGITLGSLGYTFVYEIYLSKYKKK